MLIRIDLVFSYWIFAWYLAYIAKLTTFNPKWGLILGIVENLVFAFALALYGCVISSIVTFLLVNMILKGLPLYTIYKTKSTAKDIYLLLGLFAIYTLWTHMNGTTVMQYNAKMFQSIMHGKNETPAFWAISQIRGFFSKN